MPKIIELTVELEIQRVSCPGVWLCQDGRVSLTVFALGTSYQTCLLPPMFPLLFKDVFYFKKRFQETCALNNICCLLKDETIFCELMQWCEDCNTGECTVLAQYLGALNDVLFPPNMCSNEGVDLLMRRSKDFPGILSPKIEIATKVRIDEVWNIGSHNSQVKTTSCHCSGEADMSRQRQVCHTPLYHRHRCNNSGAGGKRPRSRSRSRSGGSRSCVTLGEPDPPNVNCKCPNPASQARCRRSPVRRPRSACRPRAYATYNVNASAEAAYSNRDQDYVVDEDDTTSPRSSGAERRPRSATRYRQYKVYNVNTAELPAWTRDREPWPEDFDDDTRLTPTEKRHSSPDDRRDRYQKVQLESRYIEEDNERYAAKETYKIKTKPKLKPCVCEICKRYHELFHSEYTKSS